MNIKQLLIVIAIIAMLVTLAGFHRYTALPLTPVCLSILACTIALSFGFRNTKSLSCIGAIAGPFGILLAEWAILSVPIVEKPFI